ncbi:MAG: hypothetical protein ACKOCW_13130 [Planctomycetaceae bacterium]
MNRFFDGLPLWAALVPLGAYLLLLGWLHLRGRPAVVSGALDAILLALGLSGLVLVGPLALVRPAAGASPWSWPILLLALCLSVVLAVLVSRPRLVVYNVTPEQVRPLVAEVASGLDGGVRWAGDTAALPSRGLQVHIDGDGALRCVSVVAVGGRPSVEGWGEFGRRLRRALRRFRVRRNLWGFVPAAGGTGLLLLALWYALA